MTATAMDSLVKEAKVRRYSDVRQVLDYDRRFLEGVGRLRNKVEQRFVRAFARGRVLDAGVGTGRFALPLAQRGHSVVGLDASAAMLESVKRKARKVGVSIPVTQADLEKVPLRYGSIETVVTIRVLFHLPQFAAILRGFASVLEPGGRIVFEMRNAEHVALCRSLLQLAGIFPQSRSRGPLDYANAVAFTELAQLAAACGCRIRAARCYDVFTAYWFARVGFLQRAIDRLLRSRWGFWIGFRLEQLLRWRWCAALSARRLVVFEKLPPPPHEAGSVFQEDSKTSEASGVATSPSTVSGGGGQAPPTDGIPAPGMSGAPSRVALSPASAVATALRQVACGAGWMALGAGFARLMSYGYKVLVARLGPEAFGLVSLAVTTMGIGAALTSLGLPSSVVRYVPFYQGANDEARARGKIGWALAVGGLAALGGSALLFILAPVISTRAFHSPSLTPLIRLVAFALPLYNIRTLVLKALMGLGRTDYYVGTQHFCDNAVKLLLAGVLIFFGLGVAGAVWAIVGGLLTSLALGAYFLEVRTLPIFGRGRQSMRFEPVEWLKYASPLMLAGYVEMIHAWVDIVLLGYFMNATAVGIYSVGMLLAALVTAIPEVFLPTASPLVIRYYAQGQKDVAAHIARRVGKLVFLLALAGAVGIVLVAQPMLGVLFGASYDSALPLVYILLVGKLAWALATPAMRILSMLKRTRLIFLLTVSAALCNVILNGLLIPRYGMWGAAVATSIVLTGQSVVASVCAWREFPRGLYLPPPVLLAAALAPLALALAGLSLSPPEPLIRLLGCLFYLAAYAFCLWRWRILEAEDVAFVRPMDREPLAEEASLP